MEGNGGAPPIAVGKVLLGQHLPHGCRAQQPDHLGQIQLGQPCAVPLNVQASRRVKIQNRAQLLQVCAGVLLHLLGAELRAGG